MTKTEIDAILKRIEMRMAELGMSKETFYELSGISSASFSQWNTGAHKPTKKKLAQAAKVLQVSLEYLLTGENENKPILMDELEMGNVSDIKMKMIGLIQNMPDDVLIKWYELLEAQAAQYKK